MRGLVWWVLEAMSQRLPVVSTPVGCAPALIDDGRTGLLVPPRFGARARGADAPSPTGRDAGLRARLAEAAYPLAVQHTWTLTARQTVVSYTDAQTTRRRA